MDVEKEITDIKKRLEQLENKHQTAPAMIANESSLKQVSIKEFILMKKPTSDVTKALIIGYYLEKFSDMTSFNIKNLEDAFRQSKEPLPKNMNDVVNKNIVKGHMMEVEQKDDCKAWVVTATGEKFVENTRVDNDAP